MNAMNDKPALPARGVQACALRARRGISDAMPRLSAGLEDADDLIADLEQALG
jgi:cystathionine gamma-lyase